MGNNKELLVTLPVALGNLFTNLQVSDISASADGAMPFGAQRINDNQIKVYCNTPYDSSDFGEGQLWIVLITLIFRCK